MANHVLSYIFLINVFLCLSHGHVPAPTSNQPPTTQNSTPLSYLQGLIGAHKGNREKGIFELKKYLSKLGYMEIDGNSSRRDQAITQDLFDDNLEMALKKYQQFFKLDPSGTLDPQTASHLLLPRCGVPDFVDKRGGTNVTGLNTGSLFNFFPGEPKWWKRNLTYSFPPGTRNDVMRPIANATGDWSWATLNSFTFRYIPNYEQADIKISFQWWNHGDGSNFDGPGGTLAHAFAPSDGRIHFDGSEDWVDGAVPNKFDLQSVGLHELGHVLGLAHSGEPSAAMYPTIKRGQRKGLSQDDWIGIDYLYNIKKKSSSMYT